ncbi:MAG TPA: terminase family protein [Allosphingosinicella sp.]|nr:terminase family protein [Allosphingosinicella sp.]
MRGLQRIEPELLRAALAAIPEEERRRLNDDWPSWAHRGQRPSHEDWHVWVMLAGRGFGKTRAGAEWVSEKARVMPGARIALVAATAAEARRVMIEGQSGLIATATDEERAEMRWAPSLGRLDFASGARAFVYSAADGEGLRGPEHHFAWCDELAKWKRAEASWNNLMLGLRLGPRPQAVVTTTPRSAPVLKRVLAMGGLERSGGPSWANPHASQRFLAAMRAEHEGTRLGRQELEGIMVEEVEGALWPRALIEKARVGDSHFSLRAGGDSHFQHGGARSLFVAGESDCPLGAGGDSHFQLRAGGDSHFQHGGARSFAVAGESDCPLGESDCPFVRIVIGVDPPASADGDACGIIVCGLGADGIAYVLADCSAAGAAPEVWARKVAAAAAAWGAHRVVAEANNGGRMVESVLLAADSGLPVKLVHASDGKSARAEPVAMLFERGRAKFAGRFPELEDELAGLAIGGGYEGPTRSPDRADAMVWALTELMLRRKQPVPRVRGL